MENWDIEDRDHDWLAEEMRREGYNYRAKVSGGVLKAAHRDEEHPFRNDWKAGAVAVKGQHERRHNQINYGAKRKPQSGPGEVIVGIVFFIIFILFFILFFESAIFNF